MTEAEKDALIVQLRGDMVKYRDAYRLTKYQLDRANAELRRLRGAQKEKTDETLD